MCRSAAGPPNMPTGRPRNERHRQPRLRPNPGAGHRSGGIPRLASLRRAHRARLRRRRPRQLLHRPQGEHRAPCCTAVSSRWSATTCGSPIGASSIASSISPAPPRRPSTRRTPSPPPRSASSASLNMLGLAKRTGARIFHASTSEVYGDPLEHPQTETYWGTSIRSGRAPATTKASASPRRCSSTITASTRSTSRSCASSTPTGRA